MSPGLTGRVAVVTGGAAGIGRAFALRLAAEGVAVAVLDVADAATTLACVESAGAPGVGLLVDVSDPKQVATAAARVKAELGPVDILINNAGVYPRQPFDSMTIEQWRRVFAVNVEAMFLTVQAFSPGMRARGFGRIINLTSNTVGLVVPGMSHYVASKMAVIGLTRALATDLAEYGITVNAIGPSLTRSTTIDTRPGADAAFRAVSQQQAIKRVGVPDDLAGAAAFLASDDAAFITGQTLFVDGGLVRAG